MIKSQFIVLFLLLFFKILRAYMFLELKIGTLEVLLISYNNYLISLNGENC